MPESKSDTEHINRGMTDTGSIGGESAPRNTSPLPDAPARNVGRTPFQHPVRVGAGVQQAVAWVNTVIVVGLFVALLGIWAHWLFSGGDEASTDSITSTGSIHEAAPHSAGDTDLRSSVASTPTAEPSTARADEDSLNLNRRDRRRIQSGLRASGLDPGPADGHFGAGTRGVIRNWQAARGVPATGYLNSVEAQELIALGTRRGAGVPAETPQPVGDDRHPATGLEFPSITSRDATKGRAVNDSSRVTGSLGNDNLTGTDSDDTISGRHGKDILNGAAGNDRLDGGFGDDTINGGSGDDTIYGGHGNDFIDGGQGSDVIDGGFGNDTLHGKNGDDRIRGSHGNDLLFGGSGADNLDGRFGDDAIYGGTGDDILAGGPGRDVFHFDERHGIDRITDFRRHQDRIDVSKLPVGGFENLSLKTVRRGVRIDLTGVGGGTVLLVGLTLADLNATHFVFGSIIGGGRDMHAIDAEELIVLGSGEGENVRAEARRPAVTNRVG